MSDMTLCVDSLCPSRKHCLRRTTPASAGNQAYADFARAPDADRCECYVPDESAIKRMKEKSK
jgi:hypothetical protein